MREDSRGAPIASTRTNGVGGEWDLWKIDWHSGVTGEVYSTAKTGPLSSTAIARL